MGDGARLERILSGWKLIFWRGFARVRRVGLEQFHRSASVLGLDDEHFRGCQALAQVCRIEESDD